MMIKKRIKYLLLFLLAILIRFNISTSINATGFDYMSNATYNNTAQIITEEEYYYNQFNLDFSYYQLNDNYFNPSTLTKGTINTDGVINGTSNRAITPFINVVNKTINLKLFGYGNSGYSYMRIGIHGYNNGTHLSDSGWLYFNSVGTERTYTLPANANQMRFIISMGNKANFDTNNGEVATNISNLNTLLLYVSYNTPTTYYKYTGYNNYQNLNVYGTFYDIKPNYKYTFFTNSIQNLTINDFKNIYLAKNCINADINSTNCEVYRQIDTISYNQNNKSYVLEMPNYSGTKGVYYFIYNKGISGSMFPELAAGSTGTTGIMLLEGDNFNQSNSFYYTKLKNYYVKTRIDQIPNSAKSNVNNNYNFTGRAIYRNTTNVMLFNFSLTGYNELNETYNYNYKIFVNDSITNPGYYDIYIPNLYDINLTNNGTLYGSIPSISFVNKSDFNINVLDIYKPVLNAQWKLKQQYLGNAIGFVGESLFKGFYNSYGLQGNLYNVDIVLTQNYEFKNRTFSWYEFTNDLYLNGNNYNQFGFYFGAIGVKNTLTDNGQITPPNSSGYGNSNYEVYKTCNGNIFDDFGCYVSNAVTWTIFNIPIIGPIFNFIQSLVIGVYSMVDLINLFNGFGVLFAIFILFVLYCIIRKIYNK